jgi:mannan endo-1,4-beta-mannosidase
MQLEMEDSVMSRIVVAIVLCLISLTSVAQATGFLEDFNGNSLAGWGFDRSTFTLSATDGTLCIAYHRTAASWEWDNFNLMLPNIDVGSNPQLQLRAKSTVMTQLILKPFYANGTNDWLPQDLPGDDSWHTYTFELARAQGTTMARIYFYLDGGSVTPASGTVWLDDLSIGGQVSVDIDHSELDQVILDAMTLLGNSEEGRNEGQYVPGSKAVLQSVVDSAVAVLDDESSSQLEIDEAISSLHDACQAFEATATVREISTADPRATKETKYLFSNLSALSVDHLLFGHQDTTAYGIGWWDEDVRSDINDACGSFPAVYGWDIGRLELDSPRNLDGVNFDRMRFWIRAAYERGGISTISWHSTNPMTEGGVSDVTEAVSHILPGGERHDDYTRRLDRLARFFKSLRAGTGNSIPIIFRPFHENTGSWFWWGKDHCTPAQYVGLWQFTVEYLRDEKGVHNLLYAYSPDSSPSDSRTEYMRRYPGDRYVDVLGIDDYAVFRGGDSVEGLEWLRMIVQLAYERNKLSAITELGLDLENAHCWTDFLNPIKNDPIAGDISWVLVWRNASTSHFFAPYLGHVSRPDFVQFHDDPYTMFEPDLPDMYALSEFDMFSDGFEAGSIPQPPWSLGGDAQWFVSASEAYSGAYSAQAGFIGDDQETSLILEGDFAKGSISFCRKVSSERGFDHLRFYIDGVLACEWSGEEDWTRVSYPVGSGSHVFMWRYEKDSSISGGDDTAWVDDVVVGVLP